MNRLPPTLRLRLLLLLGTVLWLCHWATADRTLILKRPLLPIITNQNVGGVPWKQINLGRQFPADLDAIEFFPLSPSSQGQEEEDGTTVTSVPKRLLEPFQQAMPVVPSSSSLPRPPQSAEIPTQPLLQACRALQQAMAAVGQDRNAAELGRNLQKIENLHRRAPAGKRETLRSLLQYEKDELGVHNHQARGGGRRLADPSGAMGLLWVRRTLAFQERLYSNILNQDPAAPSAKAALQAYHDTLEPYHGWALQQVYSLALKNGTPSRHEMFQKLCAVPPQYFGSHQEEETAQDLRKLCNAWRPVSVRTAAMIPSRPNMQKYSPCFVRERSYYKPGRKPLKVWTWKITARRKNKVKQKTLIRALYRLHNSQCVGHQQKWNI